MFLGEFEYKVDEKGRIPLPPKFRRELKEGVVLTAGAEHCITAYSASEWNKVAAELTGSKVSPSKRRKMNRALFANAFNLALDNQGRIALPVPLRAFAGIGDEVIIAGVNNYFELWNKEQWQQEIADSQEQVWQILESLEQR